MQPIRNQKKYSPLLTTIPFLAIGIFLLTVGITLFITFLQGNKSIIHIILLFVTLILSVINISTYIFVVFLVLRNKKE